MLGCYVLTIFVYPSSYMSFESAAVSTGWRTGNVLELPQPSIRMRLARSGISSWMIWLLVSAHVGDSANAPNIGVLGCQLATKRRGRTFRNQSNSASGASLAYRLSQYSTV